MHIKILGAAAGIGYPDHTTSFLIDQDTLLDCGTGVTMLSIEEMLKIRHVLLSHSQLDHSSSLPLLVDAHATHQGPGITVYSQQETLDALNQHLFNDVLWTSYGRNANGDLPWLRQQAIEVGDTIPLADGLATALPTNHPLASIGWLIEGSWRALAFSGDTAPCAAFWHWLRTIPSLTDVICEVTYSDEYQAEAAAQNHMTPEQLRSFLPHLPSNLHLWISHMHPSCKERIMEQLKDDLPEGLNLWPLKAGTIIEL